MSSSIPISIDGTDALAAAIRLRAARDGVSEEEVVQGLIRPRTVGRDDRVAVQVRVFDDEVAAGRHEVRVVAKFTEDVVVAVVRVEHDHDPFFASRVFGDEPKRVGRDRGAGEVGDSLVRRSPGTLDRIDAED